MLQVWICTWADVPLPDRAERESMLAVTKRDRTLLLKGRLASERHLGFKTSLTAIRWLEAATDASGSHYGSDRTTWGSGHRLEDRACVIDWDRFPLKLHCVQNLYHISPFLLMSNHLYSLTGKMSNVANHLPPPNRNFSHASSSEAGGGQVQWLR
jgi:hypothetical protein